MNRVLSVLITSAFLVFVGVQQSAHAAPFSRSQTVARLVEHSPWKGIWEATQSDVAFQVTFKISGGKLTGTAWKNHSPMYDIVVTGNRVTFHIFSSGKRKIDFEGFLTEGNLSGTASGPESRNVYRRFTVNWNVSPSSD